jgi:hypothetical protein
MSLTRILNYYAYNVQSLFTVVTIIKNVAICLDKTGDEPLLRKSTIPGPYAV